LSIGLLGSDSVWEFDNVEDLAPKADKKDDEEAKNINGDISSS